MDSACQGNYLVVTAEGLVFQNTSRKCIEGTMQEIRRAAYQKPFRMCVRFDDGQTKKFWRIDVDVPPQPVVIELELFDERTVLAHDILIAFKQMTPEEKIRSEGA